MNSTLNYFGMSKRDESAVILRDALWYYYSERRKAGQDNDDIDNMCEQAVAVVDEVRASYGGHHEEEINSSGR